MSDLVGMPSRGRFFAGKKSVDLSKKMECHHLVTDYLEMPAEAFSARYFS